MKFAQLVVGPAGSGKVRRQACLQVPPLPAAAAAADACWPVQYCRSTTASLVHFSMQSTYCDTIKQHCDAINRPVHVVNLGALAPACLTLASRADLQVAATTSASCLEPNPSLLCTM